MATVVKCFQPSYARKIIRVEYFGGGAMLQLIGFFFCLTIIGAVVGIPLIIWGAHLSKKRVCSACGNLVPSKWAEFCPSCRQGFL